MRSKWRAVVLLALVGRLAVAALGHHADVVNYYWWGQDLWERGWVGFYDREIANAMPPTYPPVATIWLWLSTGLCLLVRQIVWEVNVAWRAFPSGLVGVMALPVTAYWFNKLPAIGADMVIGGLIFAWVKEKWGERAGFRAGASFLLALPFWYNSAFWGQTDSLWAASLLGGFFLLDRGRKWWSLLLVAMAVLTKPTAGLALPVFLVWGLKRYGWRWLMGGVVMGVVLSWFAYFLFHPWGTAFWLAGFYWGSLRGELLQLSANAFNLWALLFGFDQRLSGERVWGPVTWAMAGYGIYGVGMLWILVRMWGVRKFEDWMKWGAIVSLWAFLVLPQMHERYFYPALLFLCVLAGKGGKWMRLFIVAAGVHFLNLYHFFWQPVVPALVAILSNSVVERGLALVNVGVFLYLVKGLVGGLEISE